MKHPQYNPALDNAPLEDAELDQLDALLAAVPDDAAMDIEALDGYLTALLLAPQLPSADDWVPRAWGGEAGEEPPFPSGKQTKRVAQMLLRHLASIDRQLRADPDALEPFFGVAERKDPPPPATTEGEDDPAEDAGDGLWVDAGNWCAGFLIATELAPDYWEPLFEDEEWSALLQPIVELGADPDLLGEEEAERLADVAERDALSRLVPEVITALWQRRQATLGEG
ncbi:MAG TPA: UPF0149 family protein [Burkholderiaceae bacterium]|nr:UPF0149 family protein [Burkholderiaceae bacterium]HMX09996.1 UPF0149 family protein [Burkholderiaceae bacterium]HMZ00028.1 UPF0149 family protein [Burkholderiaceae bacterium]HNB43790.1 UPF0149 family protein [Burkholderiaceae bacterium]HNG79472.1 UPF0149 family protein [Burkholderiaceae bacterium]